MKEIGTDQADGLRRLMAGAAGKRVAVVEPESGAAQSGVTRNLATALAKQGREVLLLDEYSADKAALEPRDKRLVLIHAVLAKDGALSQSAARADHVVVVVQANAPAIKQAYLCIRTLHHAHALQHIRVLVNGVAESAEAQRILNNLATTGSRYLGVALEPAGWIRADPLLARAQQLNLAVMEAFPASLAARDFYFVASGLMQWPLQLAAARAPSPPRHAAAAQEAQPVLGMC
jgi:flagellar biosynthesis protein FlhG